jgi:hypothetical protein
MNFVKLFKDYNIEHLPDRRNEWVNVHCPFCTEVTGTFHGGFNVNGDYYHCWKCGTHPLNETLQLLLSIPKSELKNVLKEYEGRNSILYSLNKKESKAIKLELPTDTFTEAERKYLLKRNFNPDFLHDKYGVTGGGLTGRWKHRIIIPIYVNGRLVSWTGRSILSKKKLNELEIPRYKNLSVEESVMNPKTVLYNLDNATEKTVVLTEGTFDVMRLGDGFICSLGTELTQAQIKEVKDRFEKVFIMFDNEPEAQEKAKKFGLQLVSVGLDVEVVDAYSDYDVNDGAELNEKQVREIRKELGLQYF